MSSDRPSYSWRSTWLNGSTVAPNFDLVRRTPFATARTRPLRRGRRAMMCAAPAGCCAAAVEARDDAVRLAELLRAEDDALVPIQRHLPTVVREEPHNAVTRRGRCGDAAGHEKVGSVAST